MKREVIENSLEKDFVASLIMSDKCCNVLIPHIQMNYFDCDYSRVIVSWVIDYYKKFKKSPKKEISSIYKVRCDEILDEALKDLVYQYLKNIADSEIDINNEDYLLDQSRDYLDYQRMKEHVEQLQACLETRSMDKARKIQNSYDKISVAETNECSLLDEGSIDIIKNALYQKEEVLFTMPGELNNVIGNIHRNDFIMILAGAKKGKCVSGDTKVLMYDGSIKTARELEQGELLMGDDSTPRTILSTSKGNDTLYRVHTKSDSKGRCEIDFTCNADHILVLKKNYSSIKPISKYNKNGNLNGEYTKHGDKNYLKEDEVEISVRDYLKLSKEQKRHLKLFRTGVEYPEKQHKLSPRFLGIWLGDGSSEYSNITNPEKEIRDYIYEYTKETGDSVREYVSPNKTCPEYIITNPSRKWKKSNIRDYLNDLNLLKNKHIPNEYFIDSRKNRLELLAGLIDTDGYAAKDSYQIQFMNKQLAEDVYRLCRELGFRTKFIEKYKCYKGMYKETNGWHYSWGVNFTGNLSEIPLLLERKKKQDSKRFSSLNNSWTFEIDEVGKGDFYGVVLDGNHRYLLGDTTVTHNTWFLQKIGIEALIQRLNVTFVCLEMTREETIQRLWTSLFGVKSGLVRPGVYETARFVECPDDKGKYRPELIDVKVDEDCGSSPEELQKQLKSMNMYSSNFRIIAYPANTASVEDICNRVEDLAKDGFVTDVLIIDYADITKPIGGGTELRNQLNAISLYLRGFAMRFHCAVFTASQTNRSGYNSSVVDVNAIAEDYRKITHVTSLVSMEQTQKMKKNHIMRIRNIAMRNGASSDTCVFPQCLELGQFIFGKPIKGGELNILDDEQEGEE